MSAADKIGEMIAKTHAIIADSIKHPTVVVVMGVSSSGKTTIGALLAHTLGWPYQEGDDLHPPENVEKMHKGTPADR